MLPAAARGPIVLRDLGAIRPRRAVHLRLCAGHAGASDDRHSAGLHGDPSHFDHCAELRHFAAAGWEAPCCGRCARSGPCSSAHLAPMKEPSELSPGVTAGRCRAGAPTGAMGRGPPPPAAPMSYGRISARAPGRRFAGKQGTGLCEVVSFPGHAHARHRRRFRRIFARAFREAATQSAQEAAAIEKRDRHRRGGRGGRPTTR